MCIGCASMQGRSGALELVGVHDEAQGGNVMAHVLPEVPPLHLKQDQVRHALQSQVPKLKITQTACNSGLPACQLGKPSPLRLSM